MCIHTKEKVVTKNRMGSLAKLIFPAMLIGCACSAVSSEGAFSNYLPGTYGDFGAALKPPTDLTIRNDLLRYEGDASRSVRGGRITTNLETDLLINLTTMLYRPDTTIFGAQYVFGLMLPFADAEVGALVNSDPFDVSVNEHDNGLGDVALIPAALYWEMDRYHFSVSQIIVAPTGAYDEDALVNPGLNHWSFDTTTAFTYLNPENGREFSATLGYIYNTKNSATNYKSGQEIHLDYVFNQYFSESFALGIHGFYLEQITGDSGSGALLGDFKGESAGIGPAALWKPKSAKLDVAVILKWHHEYSTTNRMKGDYVSLSFVLGL